MVDVGELDPRRAEAIVDRMERQLPDRERQRALAVLDAREPLLLGGGDYAAVAHQAGGRIVERRVETKGNHACSSSRAAEATRSGSMRVRQSWWPCGHWLL